MKSKPQKEILIFDRMEELLEKEESFALVTVVKGPPVGQKMIVFTHNTHSSSRGYSIKNEETYNGYLYYTIRRGDTLWDIAKKYQGVSANDIMKLNHISSRKILKPGMKIKIKST